MVSDTGLLQDCAKCSDTRVDISVYSLRCACSLHDSEREDDRIGCGSDFSLGKRLDRPTRGERVDRGNLLVREEPSHSDKCDSDDDRWDRIVHSDKGKKI